MNKSIRTRFHSKVLDVSASYFYLNLDLFPSTDVLVYYESLHYKMGLYDDCILRLLSDDD